MIEIRTMTAPDILASRVHLVELLLDAVEGGASVGFLRPLDPESADGYWLGVEARVRSGAILLLGAFDTSRLVGSVQIGLANMPNGSHRAEIMKLLVHTSTRRGGIGTQLMNSALSAAALHGRTLLMLDTEKGSGAESLYRRLGWIPAGIIPRYARSSDGTLRDTIFFYKELS